MRYRPMSPCVTCQRHVRHDEGCCPFCGHEVSFRRVAPDTQRRLGRGALFAFGAATAACGSSVELDEPPVDGTTSSATTTTGATTTSVTSSSTTSGAGGVFAMYGVPPEGGGGAGGVGGDGGESAGIGGFGDLYGAPPP